MHAHRRCHQRKPLNPPPSLLLRSSRGEREINGGSFCFLCRASTAADRGATGSVVAIVSTVVAAVWAITGGSCHYWSSQAKFLATKYGSVVAGITPELPLLSS
ncbi:hypothetical protein AHAS_Ahas15G0159100 [Arachis hypogaea]